MSMRNDHSTPVDDTSTTAALETRMTALVQRKRIPGATCRMQFSKAFTFADALALVPYLDALGITDLYASPLLRAVAGSTHGYDICDPTQLNPELGAVEDFERLSAALRERGMGLILDIVPNHMGIADNCNRWWQDVLENGQASRYAGYFDIDWQPVKPELAGKVLLPILEDQYGNVLDSGKLKLVYEDDSFHLMYDPHRLPVSPRTYGAILDTVVQRLMESADAEDTDLRELQSIVTGFGYLPPRGDLDPARREERDREKEVLRRRLAALQQSSKPVRAALDETLSALNGVPGEPRSFDTLDTLITAQPYRLAFWRVAGEEINYRRFFDINTMAAIHTERAAVFDDTHRLVFDLLASGQVTALRIDHPDGLWNPARYFRQLQTRFSVRQIEAESGEALAEGAVADWLERHEGANPLYVVVEKILTEHEPLPLDWVVDGTTGYDFMAQVNGIFVDQAREADLTAVYGDFTGIDFRFSDLEYTTKQMIMRESLASELNALAHALERISEGNRHTRDFTLHGLLHAIREVIACLPIYRTYITSPGSVSRRDQTFIETAVQEAERRNPRIPRSIFVFLRDTLLLRNLDEFGDGERERMLRFVRKFQQVTGPVMAKSVEDTSFYVYNRLSSLNEVGGNPGVFGLSVEEFHEQNAKRWLLWRHAMLATSTHDTKRSEDVRARLNVLSEISDEWRAALATWSGLNADKRTMLDGAPAPDANDEYLLYQTLLGAWSSGGDEAKSGDDWNAFRERIGAYMAKATREAKVHTSWTNPNDAYDQAVQAFVGKLLDRDVENAFLEAFEPFQKRIAFYGWLNALSQTLLKLTSPGVPDTYRGAEVWDFSLVDPDNRRPVDYDRLRSMLDNLKSRAAQPDADRGALADELASSIEDGRIKLYVLMIALNYRRDHRAVFDEGDYVPLYAEGERAAHVCAFARSLDGHAIVTVVPRLIVGLTDGVERLPCGAAVWGDTRLMLPEALAGRTLRNLLTGETLTMEGDGIALANVFQHIPAALLTLQPVMEGERL